jgi:diguanylate cyclase (GGDEF)-like protein
MTPVLRETILIGDDEADVVDLLRTNLRLDGFRVITAFDGDEVLDMALTERPDCVLLDVMMPNRDGFDVARSLRADPRTRDCAILMVTARTHSADKVNGFVSGVDDYVVKPFDPVELRARILSTLRRRRDMREVSPLTGLPGNAAIARRLAQHLVQVPQNFALIHADLDDFKGFNDAHGFASGDAAIAAAGALLVDTATEQGGGFVGHIGGDDFVVLCAPEAAEAICRDAVARFGALVDGPTLSLGVALSTVVPFASATEAAAIATEMKNLAKMTPGSSFVIDRRAAIL